MMMRLRSYPPRICRRSVSCTSKTSLTGLSNAPSNITTRSPRVCMSSSAGSSSSPRAPSAPLRTRRRTSSRGCGPSGAPLAPWGRAARRGCRGPMARTALTGRRAPRARRAIQARQGLQGSRVPRAPPGSWVASALSAGRDPGVREGSLDLRVDSARRVIAELLSNGGSIRVSGCLHSACMLTRKSGPIQFTSVCLSLGQSVSCAIT
mmetsp:Transcript_28189/g.58834  ORF Transcript_28189/g.58834 Transcript_28189/m.58834 type:complete len:207 (-) Transcript_28189:65-685(-)